MMPLANADSLSTRKSLFLRLKPDAPAAELAWDEFHDRYAPIIGGFARKLGVRPQDVGDVIQDVLMGFFAASPRFEYDPNKGRFRGFLKTCTYRVVRKRWAKDLKVGGIPLDEIDPKDERIEETWNDVWETEKLRCALDSVRVRYSATPERVKTFRAFEMYALLERPAEDVASELGMKVDSVHAAKTRIRRALAKAVEEMELIRT
jgi:RNA polymerase sigma-70 factor (ECF subfamily)